MLHTLTLLLAGLTSMPGTNLSMLQEEAATQEETKDPETRALEAFQALNASLAQEERPESEEEFNAWLEGIRSRFEKFSNQWSGTAAAFQADLTTAQIDVMALGKIDRGLKTYGKVFEQAKARTAPLPPQSGMTVGMIGLMYGQALLDNDRFDTAQKVLQEVKGLVKEESQEFERAKHHLGQIEILRKVAVGQVVPNFSGLDLDGQKLTPEQYRGKVVLLDFWATWCGPCVAEMPNVVKAYKEFHEKGFDVVGISLDQADAQDAIREFSKKQAMPWRHVYDGKGWEAAVAMQFAVTGIPATFLLDRKGVIRYKGLRGEELHKAIEKLINEDIN